jgi:hypothetical protein
MPRESRRENGDECKAVDNDGWSRVTRDVRVMSITYSIFNIVVIVVKNIKGGGDVQAT